MEEKVRPGTQRRLDMQRFIADNIRAEDYYEIETYLEKMAEVRGTSVVPTLEQLLDENMSPDVLFLSYAYDKLQELLKQKSQESSEDLLTPEQERKVASDSLRDYCNTGSNTDGWTRIFDIAEMSGLSQDVIANIISNDASVPIEDVRTAYEALEQYKKAQIQTAEVKIHK